MTFNCSSLAPALESLKAEIRCEETMDPRTISVTTGRAYSDGDAVEVFVRISEDGQRAAVSDGGLCYSRRELHGIGSFSKSAETLWQDIVADYGVSSGANRVFTTGPVSMIQHMVGTIADVVLSLDSVRLLADSERSTFTSKLREWLKHDVGMKIIDDRVTDRLDHEQKITARLETPRGQVLVQAAGGRGLNDVRRSAEHAHYIFSGLDDRQWPIESRLIVLERVSTNTDKQKRAAYALTSRLKEHAYVGSFEAQLSIDRFLRSGPPEDTDLLTQTIGQGKLGQ